MNRLVCGRLRLRVSVARATAVVAAVTAMGSGCGVSVRGDFDGVPFTPDATILAVADRHELLDQDGAVVPVLKDRSAQTIHLLLTAARLDPLDDWRRYVADTLLEVKRELATSDSLLLRDVPLAAFEDGDTLTATVENGVVEGDFFVAVGAALPPEAVVADQGLGSKLRVTVSPRSLDARPRGGSIQAEIEIQREVDEGQAEVATGSVGLGFGATLLPERLAEANLTVADPVVRCMQEKGPSRAASCRDVEAQPYTDETGLVAP